MTTALQPAEKSRLAELETTIERGRETFIEVGNALAEIRDSRLYRDTHGSFAVYVEERWKFTRGHAYRIIESAKVAVQMTSNSLETNKSTSPMGDTSANSINERQARELARVPEANRVEVLAKAKKTGKVTAETIREAAVETISGPPGSDAGAEVLLPAQLASAPATETEEENPFAEPVQEPEPRALVSLKQIWAGQASTIWRMANDEVKQSFLNWLKQQ